MPFAGKNPAGSPERILEGKGRRVFGTIRTEVGSWPVLMRLGLAVFGVGGLADLLYHALPPQRGLLGAGPFWAHAVTLVGMVLTMLGILTAGRWKRSRPKSQAVDHSVLKIPEEV
jgi:hypothetical protein